MARFGGVIFALVALLLGGFAQAGQTVLLVSIDGFRARLPGARRDANAVHPGGRRRDGGDASRFSPR